MNTLKKILKWIYDSKFRFKINASYGLYNWMSDEKFLKKKYKRIVGAELNIDNPILFCEKLQWLKLHDRKPIYTTMVDKLSVKDYVSKKIGAQYIIPTIGEWATLEEIDFDLLPEQFVLKCTHDSGGVVIVKDKTQMNISAIKRKVNKALKRNYYYTGREWPYKNIKPRIIVEKYMTESNETDIKDYKFYVFNGIPCFCQVISNRYTDKKTIDFFDMNWTHQNFTGLEKPYKEYSKETIMKPHQFELMKEFSTILAKDIPFVRVDFYEIDEKLYFGEFTFYPASGFGEFHPKEWNKTLGDLINIV